MGETTNHMGLGATGKFPHGKLNSRDEGEIKTAIYTEKDKIVINFGKSIKWLAMTADEALQLASFLTKRANDLKTK